MRSMLVIALAAAIGCSDKPTKIDAPRGGGAAGGAAADDAAIVVALWPAQWSKLQPMIDAAGPAAVGPLAIAARELGTPWLAMKALALRGLGVSVPDAVPGLDEKRPIVIAALAPIETHEAIAASVAARFARGSGTIVPAGLRHRALVPATDPAALAAELRRALAETEGLTDLRDPVATYGDDERLIRITADASAVSIVAVSGVALSGLDAAGRDRVLGGRGPWTPALHPLMTEATPSVVRVHLRLDRFADTAPVTGMVLVTRAIAASASPTVGQELMAGWSEVLTSVLVADPASALATDAIADLPAGARFAPTAVVLLTEAGRTALRADAKLAGGAPTAITDLDLAAIGRAAALPPVFGDAKRMADVAQLMHECGASCTIYLGLGNGLPLFAIAEKESPGSSVRGLQEVLAATPPLAATRVTLSGTALVIDPTGTAGTAPAERVRALPIAARPAPSAASRCYFAALAALRKALAAGAREASGGDAMLAAVEREQASNLECAGKDPVLAPRVERLRAAVTAVRELAARATPP